MGTAAATATIDAPIGLVWDVMIDTAAYPEWNPFIVRVDLLDGPKPALGRRVRLHVRWDSGGSAKATERITALDAPADGRARLDYDYGGPIAALGLVRGRRRQELIANDDGTTTYETDETLRGLLSWSAPLAKVQNGFERHAGALKARAESLHAAASA